jgi:hypothetical protein
LAALLATPAGALSLNLGGGSDGLINLGGDSSADSSSSTSVNVTTNGLANGDDDGTLLNLFGNGSTVADIGLGTGDTTTHGTVTIGDNDDLLVDLFGPSGTAAGDTSASASIGGLGLGDGAAGGDLLDLFGSSNSTETSGTIQLGGLGTDELLNLFGPGSGSGAGAGAGSGAGAAGGSGSGAGGGMAVPSEPAHPGFVGGIGTGVQVADLGKAPAKACFVPDETQVSTLLNRHSYADASPNWAGISEVQIVEIGVCPDAKLRIAEAASANANYFALKGFVSGQDAIRASLLKSGHAIGDVVAVDQNGSKLIVYVI